jgi:hypothetical protein
MRISGDLNEHQSEGSVLVAEGISELRKGGSKMGFRTRVFVLFATVVVMSGCGYPAFTSAMRTNFPADAKVEMKCEHVEMSTSRDSTALNEMLSKYSKDGWRLAYLSEYTSTGISTFSNLICIERSLK